MEDPHDGKHGIAEAGIRETNKIIQAIGCLLRIFVPKNSSLSIVVGRDENSTEPIGCEWPSIVNWNRAHSAVGPHSLNTL